MHMHKRTHTQYMKLQYLLYYKYALGPFGSKRMHTSNYYKINYAHVCLTGRAHGCEFTEFFLHKGTPFQQSAG